MPEFRTIHTAYGLAAMASAEATGTPINLTHMAVGDGNGNPVDPSETQTNLVRELFRAPVNRVTQDPTDPKRFTAELVIPATTGGFVLREVGVFDEDGTLFAVGNLPETYKPVLSEGAYADTVVRLEFMVNNASVITLQVDPNVVVATRTWITNNITAGLLLPGGTTHQVLRKKSNSNGDTEWADAGDVNVVVSTIEEHQVLAALQTSVVLSTVTTNGLAVYINGERLDQKTGATGWQPDPADPDTTIILGASYAAGTRLTAVQNEPLGDVPFPLARDQNLADLQNKATARANLDVYSRAEVRNMIPPGIVDHFAGETPPSGWLVRDGSAISRTAYADLFARLGTRFGPGDGFNTFNLPDDRDLFDRGWGGVTSGRALGSYQADEIKSHKHQMSTSARYSVDDTLGNSSIRLLAGDGTIDATAGGSATLNDQNYITATGGTETRPKNRAYLPIIKF